MSTSAIVWKNERSQRLVWEMVLKSDSVSYFKGILHTTGIKNLFFSEAAGQPNFPFPQRKVHRRQKELHSAVTAVRPPACPRWIAADLFPRGGRHTRNINAAGHCSAASISTGGGGQAGMLRAEERAKAQTRAERMWRSRAMMSCSPVVLPPPPRPDAMRASPPSLQPKPPLAGRVVTVTSRDAHMAAQGGVPRHAALRPVLSPILSTRAFPPAAPGGGAPIRRPAGSELEPGHLAGVRKQ